MPAPGVIGSLPIMNGGRSVMGKPEFELIMSYTAKLADPEVIGATPEGIPVNFYVTGGEVTGPKSPANFAQSVPIG